MSEQLSDDLKQTIRLGLVQLAGKCLDIPYELGAEVVDYNIMPVALDCSELVEYVYNANKLKMPDGSQNQFLFTQPTGNPLPGDLAFFGKEGNPNKIYHVGMVFDKEQIIEARAFDPTARFETGKVILRPIDKWTRYKNFCGFRVHPKLAT